MKIINLHRAVLLFATLAIVSLSASAAKPPVNNGSDSDYAIHGYDVVAYFTAGQPTAGDEAFQAERDGAVWIFATATNRDKFVVAPEKYAPQYGGYCAYGVARGYAPDIDPHAWKIVDGKLYLNYNTPTQRRWEEDIPGYITTANDNWPAVLNR